MAHHDILAGKWVFEEGIGRGVVPHSQLRHLLMKVAQLVDEGRVRDWLLGHDIQCAADRGEAQIIVVECWLRPQVRLNDETTVLL